MSNGTAAEAYSQRAFRQSLKKYYGIYTGGFIAFVIVLAIAEQLGMPNRWIGYAFLVSTVVLYAVIGVMSRTADIAEYYVAGRRVPALFTEAQHDLARRVREIHVELDGRNAVHCGVFGAQHQIRERRFLPAFTR